MLLNSGQFKFLKNYRNVNVKSSAKREVYIWSRATGALILASEASCARRECASEASRFFIFEP